MIYKLSIYKYFICHLLISVIASHHHNSFLFSVIISIYNTGKYLNDSIGSLLTQTIGFEEHIQVILVNDGSTDNSEEICLYYKNKYPENIIYVYKNNGGLSSARNTGLDYINGKYVNFLDPDDLWSKNTFQLAYYFFRLYPNIDIVAGRMKYFEADENYHPLDYKFYKSRVIDLLKEYDCIHLSVASSFFRKKSISRKKFVEGVISGEDTLFVNNLLLNKPFMGVIKTALYLYRKRTDGSSIVQNAKINDIFYFTTPKKVHFYLLNLSFSLFNKIQPFIQYYIAYDILFRMLSSTYKYINLPKYIKYCQIIIELLKKIEDKFILCQKNVKNVIKIYALSKKHNEDIRKYIYFENDKIKYQDIIMIDPKKNRDILNLKYIYIKDDFLHLKGKDNCWVQRSKYFYYCKIGNNIFYPSYQNFKYNDLKTMFGTIVEGRIVNFDIPINIWTINENIEFYLTYMNNSVEIFPLFGYFSKIPQINNSYYVYGKFILTYDGKRLKLLNNKEDVIDDLERNYCKELEKYNKNELIVIRKKVIKYFKKNRNKEIWLINDRPNKAGDNGEYFFRYLKNKNPSDIRFFFVIKEDCSDYQRLKELDNILVLGSKKYNITFLKSNKIITSTSNGWVDNPFGNDRKYMIDLFHFDLIFLQHGISKDDISNFLNRFVKNYSLIITASKKEYKSFLSIDYDYSRKNIKLTGFSRFDNLKYFKDTKDPKNIILVIPTWRMNVKGTVKPVTYESIYSDNVVNTDFFKFYNNLINSPRLLESMKKYNYTGIFCLHPSFISQTKDFNNNTLFTINNSFDYQKILSQASLMITDYSSIFFDFAFLEKPIIYAHFDYEEYRNNHYKKGYFDYILDGFGPVCFDLEKCIDSIIDVIERGCKINNKYLKRIKKFFAFFDINNNDRIYKVIRELSINNGLVICEEDLLLNFVFFIALIFIFKIINRFKN